MTADQRGSATEKLREKIFEREMSLVILQSLHHVDDTDAAGTVMQPLKA